MPLKVNNSLVTVDQTARVRSVNIATLGILCHSIVHCVRVSVCVHVFVCFLCVCVCLLACLF